MNSILSVPKNIWSSIVNSVAAINTISEANLIKATTERLLLQKEINKLSEEEKNILIEELKIRREEGISILKKAISLPILVLSSIIIIILFVSLFLNFIIWLIGYLF